MKKPVKFVFVLIILGLIFPAANLVVKPDNTKTISSLRANDSDFCTVAAMLENKCAGCHVSGADLPFYANFPVAGSLMEKDIEQGLRFFDMKEAFAGDDGPVAEVPLAKIEQVLHKDTMPPLPYLVMHWDSGLGDSNKENIDSWIDSVRTTHHATAGVATQFKTEAVQPLPPPEAIDPKMVALGDRLFHDTRLSGDDTISCATCHALDKGGTDQLQFSKGIRDQVGGINAPTVYNAVFAVKQFWDGRAADLEEQAGGPVTNPIEMGAEWPAVIAKLEQDEGYRTAFASLFSDGINNTNVQRAIAAFEKTLVTTHSKFDGYLTGDENALTAMEKEGYALFKENDCATCHAGKAMGGLTFEYMGLREDYFADRGEVQEPDQGLFNFTGKENDRHKFKVPTLRNIAQTFPYFHDGSTSDLKEAVTVMGKYQTGVALADDDAGKITAFLETLTGEYQGKLLQ